MHQAVARPMAGREVPRGSAPLDIRHVRLLVIDDDPQARELVEAALIDAHFERMIDVVSTARRGLKCITADEHDVYIIDHRLPDGTGIEIIRHAKKAGVDKPCILITGYGSGALDEAALREGAADYVEKHLLGTYLERAIRYALRDWQSSRALREREEQLRHAQKMEGIGRLAGGIAHDFNNLLTAIIGYTDLVIERLDSRDPTTSDVRGIRKAADHAVALTRQLLAFSRKQFLDPRVLDLNETASGLIRMLPRIIGEHIETTTRLAPDLGPVWADPSQLDQLLINLVLNARDAMPAGGRLTIETANMTLDDQRIVGEGLTIPPGRYVMLSIADTGVGMTSAVRARAFEPFFTTKPHGHGTGLGLSTVYGIVDQSGGAVALDSAPGHGTTVRIYLPVTSESPKVSTRAHATPVLAGSGTETVLLVDDNEVVRQVTAQALRRRGYTVYEAGTPDEAIDWSVRSKVVPHLLVTDVVMPHMSGPELAKRLVRRNRELRVLYMSGYTDDTTAVRGSRLHHAPLLQKPFTPGQLAQRVRQALEASHGRT